MLTLTLEPIGVIHTPFADKRSAPRQPSRARGVTGRVELVRGRGLEYAVSDLSEWSHVWLVFWFHLNRGWRPKVRPPRSAMKRGVLSTRSPHRPNPIGLSLVKLEAVDGLTITVSDVDLVDGTPILDIKPYVPYSDYAVSAGQGWLERQPEIRDPGPAYTVEWTERALRQLAWLGARGVRELRAQAEEALSAGPAPHPYRRIRKVDDHFTVALQDFRLDFVVDEQRVTVLRVRSGYRDRALRDPDTVARGPTPLAVHRALVREFG